MDGPVLCGQGIEPTGLVGLAAAILLGYVAIAAVAVATVQLIADMRIAPQTAATPVAMTILAVLFVPPFAIWRGWKSTAAPKPSLDARTRPPVDNLAERLPHGRTRF